MEKTLIGEDKDKVSNGSPLIVGVNLIVVLQAPNVALEEVALAAATALPETFGSFSGRMVSVVLGGGGSPSKPVKNYYSTRIFRCSLKAPTLMCWRQKILEKCTVKHVHDCSK